MEGHQNIHSPCQELNSNVKFSDNSPPITPSLLSTHPPLQDNPQDSTSVEERIIDVSVNFTPDIVSDYEPTLTPKTKAATAILRVTGPNSTVTELDFLRHKLKCNKAQNKQPSDNDKEEYATLLSKLHEMVTSKIQEAKRAIRDYETNHYHKYNIFPDQTKQEYKILRKQLDNARNVHSIWSTFKLT